jgi:hypothetical protein
METAEWRSYQRVARAQGMTLSEWARQALRKARSAVAGGDVESKLAAIRGAARNHRAPAPEIDQMLAETERGYTGDDPDGRDA